MNSRLALRAVVLCLLGLAPRAGMAQQISHLLVQPAVAVGEPVQIRVYLDSPDAAAGCGLRVALGDGNFRDLRADMRNIPVTFSHTYSRGGEFTIRVVGDLYLRGFRTAFACGGARNAAISVVDVAAERRRQAAEMEAQLAREREQREAAEREALLAQQKAEREAAERERELEAQERLLREREAEVRRLAEQRERELAERAATLRWMELKAAAREQALQAREKAAREPARTVRRAPSAQASSGASSGSSGKPSQKSAKPSGSASRGTLDAF